MRRVATSALVPRRRHPRLSPPPFGLVAALVLIALFGMAVAPERPTSPLKKRVWGFADPLSGRLSPWPDAAHGTATGYDQLAEKTASGRADTKDEDPTGLLNEGFRYRDLDSGEFITRDLAGFIDGPNVYTYVNQNPWTKFDVQGLFAVPPQGLVHATPEQRATFNRIANNTIAGVAVTAAVGLTGGAALPELVAGSAGRIGLSAVANGAGGAAAQASNNVQTGQPVGTNVPQATALGALAGAATEGIMQGLGGVAKNPAPAAPAAPPEDPVAPSPAPAPASAPSQSAASVSNASTSAATSTSKQFSQEKQALVDMAKGDKRSGMTPADMQAYKELNKGLPDPFPTNKVRGPEAHPDANLPSSQEPHGHVGPVDHIPIKDPPPLPPPPPPPTLNSSSGGS